MVQTGASEEKETPIEKYLMRLRPKKEQRKLVKKRASYFRPILVDFKDSEVGLLLEGPHLYPVKKVMQL